MTTTPHDMQLVYQRPRLLTDTVMHYCPGCSHGTAHNLVARAIEQLGAQERTVGVAPVGCAVFIDDYIDIDWAQAAHGRAPAVATAMKRLCPDKLVFTYQGDGDLAAIGAGEIIAAANRGDSIAVIFINNAIYGMTGGQMAPTTLLGMKTATTPGGRSAALNGYPFKVADVMAMLDGVTYVTRQSVDTAAAVRKAEKAILRAFDNSLNNRGLSFVEIVATCNSGWKMTPVAANRWMNENMHPAYPLGDIKTTDTDPKGIDTKEEGTAR